MSERQTTDARILTDDALIMEYRRVGDLIAGGKRRDPYARWRPLAERHKELSAELLERDRAKKERANAVLNS